MALQIPANDHGQIRVFATDQTLPDDAFDKEPESIAALFGTDLDPTYVDVIRLSDLGEMPLTTYIAEGYDMAADLVDATVVNGLTGTVVLVLSRASGGREMTLTPTQGLRHVTTYSATQRIVPLEPLVSEAATGTLEGPPAKKPMSNARQSGMVATVALLVMFALVGLMIWVAG